MHGYCENILFRNISCTVLFRMSLTYHERDKIGDIFADDIFNIISLGENF